MNSASAENIIHIRIRRTNKSACLLTHTPFSTAIPRTNLSVSHTLCPVELNNELWPYVDDEIGSDDRPLPLFYIDVFTYSSKTLFYSILVEPLYDFDIR